MGKAIIYIAGIIMFAGVITHNFIHDFPGFTYIIFLAGCVLLAVIGYIIDRKQSKKNKSESE